ncbi:MAG: glycogen synthase GlgA [Clostridia bacterium]|nr:glycogen synthase GlgA [Clostridia bacterium]
MDQSAKPRKEVLFALSECVPFIKSGGLADVGGSLPFALNRKKSVRVSVIMPQYSAIPADMLGELEHVCHFDLSLGWRRKYCGINKLVHRGITFYFVDNRDYFSSDYLYGYGAYEAERFAFFCTAVLEAIPRIGISPDILHCHDWQAGMIPALLKIRYSTQSPWNKIKTVFTIHNLMYQGVFNQSLASDMFNLDVSHVTAGRIGNGGDLNFMKAALTYSDKITTVSPSYAREIMTPWAGEGLDSKLVERQGDVSGILNGIDERSYDPSSDPELAANYSPGNLSGKYACKKALLAECGFPDDDNVPVMGMIGRLVSQKGLDLVERVLEEILMSGVSMVVLGTGDRRYSSMFQDHAARHPGRMAAFITFNNGLARRIYAGSDLFLMPSLFEPCGLAQMISLKYGTLPIVRETGGLRDTVFPFNETDGTGNGFTFHDYNAHEMLYSIQRAVRIFKTRPGDWLRMQTRGMRQDFSWKTSASEYVSLYLSLSRDS